MWFLNQFWWAFPLLIPLGIGVIVLWSRTVKNPYPFGPLGLLRNSLTHHFWLWIVNSVLVTLAITAFEMISLTNLEQAYQKSQQLQVEWELVEDIEESSHFLALYAHQTIYDPHQTATIPLTGLLDVRERLAHHHQKVGDYLEFIGKHHQKGVVLDGAQLKELDGRGAELAQLTQMFMSSTATAHTVSFDSFSLWNQKLSAYNQEVENQHREVDQEVVKLLNNQRKALGWTSIGMMVSWVCVGVIMTVIIIQPLRKLLHKVREIKNTMATSIDPASEYDLLFKGVEQLQLYESKLKIKQLQLERNNAELKRLDTVKTDFLSNVSHELRTPLTSIRMYNQLMFDEDLGKVNPQQKDALRVILESTDHLITLINELLEVKKMEEGKLDFEFKPYDLKTVIDEAIQTLGGTLKEQKVQVKVEFETEIKPFLMDKVRMMEVIINLVGNSVKFNRSHHPITIKVKQLTGYKEKICQIIVIDQGQGIKPEDQANLFNKFYQAKARTTNKAPGTGLGLSITKQIINAHGGEILVASEYGQGTTISIHIPMKAGVKK